MNDAAPATFAPRRAVVRIYAGDDLDRIRDLELRAEALREASEGSGTPRLGHETPEYLQIAAEHDALVAEAQERAVDVVLQALPRRQWKQLIEEHPPRTGDAKDISYGMNRDTFQEAVVPLSIVEPEWAAEEEMLEQLSSIDFERLWLTVLGLNRAPVADPKASLVSRMTQKKDETSS